MVMKAKIYREKDGTNWVGWFPAASIRVSRYTFKGLMDAIGVLHRYGKLA